MLVQEIFVQPRLLLSAQYKIFFSSLHTILLYLFVPNAQQAGQAVVPGRLSLNMCLWSNLRQVGWKEVDVNDVRMPSCEYAGRQHNMFPEKIQVRSNIY